jgi:hypothetical protein
LRKSFLIAGLSFALWGLISALSYDAAFISSIVTQFFAGGRTYFKAYFFHIWAAVMFLLLALPMRSTKRPVEYWAIAALLLTQAINLFTQICYMRMVGAGLGNYSIAVVNNRPSTSSLIHSHTMKAIMIPLMRILHVNPESLHADSGLPFLTLIPKWALLLGLGFTLLTIALTIPAVLKKRDQWTGRRSAPFWMGLVLSSYVVLKSLVDGGPFSTDFLIFFPVFLILMLGTPQSPEQLIKKSLPFWAGALCIIMGLYLVWQVPMVEFLLHDIVLLAVFVSVLLLLLDRRPAPRFRLSPHLLWLLPLLGFLGFHYFWTDGFKYLRHTIRPGVKFFLLDFQDYRFPLTVKYSEGNLRVYEGDVSAETSYWYIHRRFGIPPSHYILAVPDSTCSLDTPFMESGTIRVLGPERIRSKPKSDLFRYFRVENCRKNEGCDYRFEAMINPCVPDDLYQPVINHLTELGLRSFVLMGPER